ncbi:PEP-CTERM sorting domain-containing protein [Nostoc sp. TCL26-01]|uniref:PEP-CTERM sorting domain-containing protein n=1 Tax=Nostoc sp. TCL26-01 TaxID=2576904 RepID=UPI0015BE7E81|nr:PEP-CTERM sorting domain-containing protein [Nostoc sp. TCL26-01]QLE54805.1 PEP-CTERM sorting domain-containing protein [Nostoc sp. TCL26-01]
MNLWKSRKLHNVATIATATIATLGFIGTNPAAAAILKLSFCGFFEGNPNNGSVDGFLIIDDSFQNDASKNFGLVDAEIKTTTDSSGANPLTYTFKNFQTLGQGLGIAGLDPIFSGGESKFWRFFDTVGNNFNVVLPISVFPLQLTNGRSIDFNDNSEQRISLPLQVRKDPDKLRITPVPEPTSIFGTAIALALGGMLTKKNLSKLSKNKVVA